MSTMKTWITKLLGTGDEVSSKRVIGVLGALVLFASLFVGAFFPNEFQPSDRIVEAVEYVTIAMFFGTAAEKFARRGGGSES